MRFELGVALRYLKSGHKNRFVSLVTLISVFGVAVGVTTLIVVIAVMSGFDNDLRDKIVSLNPQVYIQAPNGLDDPETVIKKIENLKDVEAASPFIEGQALFFQNKYAQGVLMRGINPAGEIKVTRLRQYLVKGSLPKDKDAILVGSEIAKSFGLTLGEEITVVSPAKKGKKYKFKICGIFNSGMYDYDANLVYTNIAAAQEFFDMPNLVNGIGVRVNNLFKASEVKSEITKTLGMKYWVRTWMEVNRNLFSSLKLEKTVMFIILVLIVLVACFNIVSTLIMTVMEKTKDIGILKSLGASRASISLIFTLNGIVIGALGTVLGAGAGFLICYLLKTYKFIKLPSDIYYVDTLPVQIQWSDSLVIALSALIISFLATLYPAYQASRLNPVEALRYE
jgi:lipoprotein-releasing system permease protein